MLTGHIQLMPRSQAPECLSSTFVFEITTLCNFMLHNQLLREGFIQWHWLLFLPPYFLSFPLFAVIEVDETAGDICIVICVCPVLITDCSVILLFVRVFLLKEKFITSENNFTVVSQIKQALLYIRGNHFQKTYDFTSSFS